MEIGGRGICVDLGDRPNGILPLNLSPEPQLELFERVVLLTHTSALGPTPAPYTITLSAKAPPGTP
eukprot:362393-Chlamydomonas_euryale.AAC.5